MKKLDNEPRLSGISPQMLDWARLVALVVNGLVDAATSFTTSIASLTASIAALTTALGLKADINSQTFTGTPRAPTVADTDNSTSLATTAWAKLGFAASFGSNGYIKLPSWMGSWIAQWGGAATGASGVAVTLPITFPTAVYGILVTPQAAGPRFGTYQSPGVGSFFMQAWDITGTQQNTFCSWYSLGK